MKLILLFFSAIDYRVYNIKYVLYKSFKFCDFVAPLNISVSSRKAYFTSQKTALPLSHPSDEKSLQALETVILRYHWFFLIIYK